MDLFREHCVLIIIAFTLIQQVSAFCQDEMIKDEGYKACAKRYHEFIEKHEALNGTRDAEAVFDTLCSAEGRKKFHCMLRYYINCPPLLNSDGPAGNPFEKIKIPGVEVSSFLFLDSMENICAMNTGTCSEVKKCNTGLEQTVGYKPEPTPDYFLMFQTATKRICGEIKDAMTCLLESSENCPRSLDEKLEESFQNLMHRRMNSLYNEVSYKQAKHFILNECPKMASDFSEDMCSKDVFISNNFTDCNEDVVMKYSQKHNCAVHEQSKKCVMNILKPECGVEKAKFLTRNSHMIFPGIPNNCENGGSGFCPDSFAILLFLSLFLFF